jgi:hypothetical protein
MRLAIPRWHRPGSIALLCALCRTSVAWATGNLALLLACRDVGDSSARLACFDRESSSLASVATAPTLAPEQKFGLPPAAVAAQESAAAGRPELAEFPAHLAGLEVRLDGRSEFKLDNGQVWRQLIPGEELLVKPGDSVKLLRGALGSYWLRTDSGRGCKVRRIR